MATSNFALSENLRNMKLRATTRQPTRKMSGMKASPYDRKALDDLLPPAESWSFRVLLPEITADTNRINEAKIPPGDWKSNTEELNIDYGLNVESIDFSLPSITPNPRKYCGRDMNYPGRVNVDSFAIKFYENHNYEITNYITLWRQKIINDVGDYGLPAEYKKPIICWAYDTIGEIKATFKLLGCFPEKLNGYSYDSAGNGTLVLNCAFSCDWVSFL